MGYLCLTITRQMEEVLQWKKQNPSDKLRKEAAMKPPINSVSERVIGSFDRYMREKLNATTLNLESTILFEKSKISSLVNKFSTSTKICIWTWHINQQEALQRMIKSTKNILVKDFGRTSFYNNKKEGQQRK